MQAEQRLPLAGIKVVEFAGGAAGAYCGRLLVDAGATVVVTALAEAERLSGIVRTPSPCDEAYSRYLSAGKHVVAAGGDPLEMQRLCLDADLVLVGEDSSFDPTSVQPRRASIDLSWFGERGAYRDWQGNDLIVQALTGLPHMAGTVEGPPLHAGDRHATMVAGVTAYIAAVSAVLARQASAPRRLEINVLEANLALSEMHMHFFERDGIPMQRHGINRFHPNSPVGVYPCKVGWVGITATTPDQWKSLCVALEMHKEAADERLMTRELRFARLDEVEQAMIKALAARTADEWAALGRRHKVPIVVVPDAGGILAHPVFREREALATFAADGTEFRVPRTPFGLSRTPTRRRLDAGTDDTPKVDPGATRQGQAGDGDEPPLAGMTVVDFAMGWAGPLASRLLADLGADVLKIEAGRYPDWWRGVNWTAEYIEGRLYENAKGFCALNRGKRGVSVDLTTPAGRDLAQALIAGADAVVENQAAGVMGKLGLGYEQLSAVNPGLVMLSMSAFGTGNSWSETRAYGSTLEQGAGLPSFMGFPGTPPTMYQLAYGDPIGGLFGCAALLTAMVDKRRSGQGQYVNLSMVEAMLQFTTQPLLQYQLDPGVELRKGNRHAAFVPQGIYPAAGDDQWIALSVRDHAAFAQLAAIIGRPDWAADATLASLQARIARADEIDAAIAAWSAREDRDQAARTLQAAGVAGAPLFHAQELFDNPHLTEAGFFIDMVREFSGPQRQAGLSIVQNGRRLGARKPAPLLGEHSWEVLGGRGVVTRERYDALVRDDVITFAPKALRAAILPSVQAAAAAPADR